MTSKVGPKVATFTSRIINGCSRYRVSEKFTTVFSDAPENENSEGDHNNQSFHKKIKKNPHFLKLPPLALPEHLDLAAINYLRENSSSSPKSISLRATSLTNYLWARSLPDEKNIIAKKLKKSFKDDQSSDIYETEDNVTLIKKPAVSQVPRRHLNELQQEAIDEWKSLRYSAVNCQLYLVARLAPNFASMCRVLYEVRKRCPRFVPRNLFDFGSGLGTVTWAVNNVWPPGCVTEHLMLESSPHMARLSEFLLRSNQSTTMFPGIYQRGFIPSSKRNYDLVVSGHSLLELPGAAARLRILKTLWDLTDGFLVLVEQGTRSGFQAILEARDWLLREGGEDVNLFAPCPHSKVCGKADSVCNFFVSYYQFGLVQERNEPQGELISYLIVSRGDWRRFQHPSVEPESTFLPRIVSRYKGEANNAVVHDICHPSGVVERTAFPNKATERNLRYFLRHASAGDILPCEESSKQLVEPALLDKCNIPE